MELKANTTLHDGRYIITSCIGNGGFGITYLGTDVRLGRKIVLKEYFPKFMVKRESEDSTQVVVLSSEYAEELKKGITKFLSEAKTLALLDEIPQIATVHDFFQENGTAYIVMEYIKGRNLKQIIRERKQPFDLGEAIDLIRPCLVALDKVHQAGLIHRDFTPDNIIINDKGEPKIIDFGSSRDYVANEATMTIMVKHGYAPAEQYSNGVKQGTYTDVYSISAIIYEMITLQKPAASIERFMKDPVLPPSAINPVITADQDSVIMKGLAVNFESRFMTIRALLSAIDSVTGNNTAPSDGGYQQYAYQTSTQTNYQTAPQANYNTSSQPNYQAAGYMQSAPVNNVQQTAGAATEFVGNTSDFGATELVGGTTGGNASGFTGSQPYVQQQQYSQNYQYAQQPPVQKKKSKKGLIIGLVAALVVVLGGIGVAVGAGSSHSSDTSSVASKDKDDDYGTDNKKSDDEKKDSETASSASAVASTSTESTAQTTKKAMKVGISFPTKDLQRWNNDGYSMASQLESNGVEVDLQFASNDVTTQISQIENMINGGCSVLVVGAIDGSSLISVLKKARDAGIEVISYDRLVVDADAVSYYITFNVYQVGHLQGEYIEEQLGLSFGRGPYNMEIFAGDPGDNNAAYFYKGAMDVLQKYINNGKLVVQSGQTSFADVATASWSSDNAYNRALNIINSYYADGTELHAILCSNDSTASGAMDAVYEDYPSGWPLVITGQDCDKINVKNIIGGYQSMSVFRQTEVEVEQTVKMTMQILNGETVDINDKSTYIVPAYLCDAIVVTADNYKEILIDSGYYTEADLSN